MLFYAILKVEILICAQCTGVHQYHSVWDYSSPNSCPRQRTEIVNSEGSAETRDDPYSFFFPTSFGLENLLAHQECNTQHLGISIKHLSISIKLWV